jgi:hypothetical protein
VIIGLPRTGTTLLQHLLAQDPAHRVLRNWEATSPAPPPRAGDDADPRIVASERGMKLLDYLAPDARALHPVAPTLPTECVTLFSNSCASLELATINFVPSYLRFCLEAVMAPHYDYFRRQLLTLQWHDPRERWLLKSPAHLFWVGELLDALPAPASCRPIATRSTCSRRSAASLRCCAASAPTTSTSRPWASCGRRSGPRGSSGPERSGLLDPTTGSSTSTTRPRRRPSGHRAAHLLGVRPRARSEAESGMRRYLDEHPQHGAGVHRYTLEQFGLDRATEAARFAHLAA